MFRSTNGERETPVNEEPRAHRRANETPTYVSNGSTLRGELDVNGAVQVHGSVEGCVTAAGDVEIGSEGSLKADVSGRNITVAGTVRGKIYAQERVLLVQGAHVEGDIHAQSLKIEDGVFFQGNCVMGESAREARPGKILELFPDSHTAAKVARG
jgi:cytoskeletal protein CcmA (bactofilin family)